MTQTILLKRSGNSSNTPSSLSYGELALNYADGKLFYKNSSGNIVEFSSGASGSFLSTSGGTVTGNLTVSNNLYIGDGNDGYFYNDQNGRTAFANGDFYIQDTVSTFYNYATNQYYGGSSGDNIYFRSNVLSGTGWGINGAGMLTTRDHLLNAGYHLQRADHHSGHLEGSYNNVGSNESKSNPIYSIGSSYNPNSTTLGNMYGIGFSYSNASFINFSGGAGWGMYVAADGDARVWLNGSEGTIASTGQHYVGSNVVYNAGNDGSGSGLDADTVDSVHASSFIRRDTTNTVSDYTKWTRWYSNTSMATSSGYESSLEVFSNGSGNDAFMSFHVGGDYATYFGLDGGTNKLSVGGWSMGAVSHAIYHEGNKPTLSELGYTGATNANYITNNNQLTNGAGYITSASLPSVGNGTLTVTGAGSVSGSGTFTANQSGNTTITLTGSTDADTLDGKSHESFGATLATYGTTGAGSGRIRCTAPFTTNSAHMFQITISLYKSYHISTYVVGAYMYPSTNQWYSPKCLYTGTETPDIIVGRDNSGYAYISIANGNYTGVRVHNMTRGYYTTVADTYDPWNITLDNGTENSVSVAVSKIWHSDNDSANSGLDSDLLDGQQGAYYLNYNNFSNTPSIPSVGNGTLTINTSGSASGGGTFTANQSGNSTITINGTGITSYTETDTLASVTGSAFKPVQWLVPLG